MNFEDYLAEQKKWQNDILLFLRKDRTWFSVDEKRDKYIELSSRDYGDVGNERPGKEDIKEASRLVKELRKRFGKIAKVSADTIDEWVMVYIDKK